MSHIPSTANAAPNNPFALLDVLRLSWKRSEIGWMAATPDSQILRHFHLVPSQHWQVLWIDQEKRRQMRLDCSLDPNEVALRLTRWHLNALLLSWSNPPKPDLLLASTLLEPRHPGALAQHLSLMLRQPLDASLTPAQAIGLLHARLPA
jgi:hypothetical protein